jgi:hypothetical protein
MALKQFMYIFCQICKVLFQLHRKPVFNFLRPAGSPKSGGTENRPEKTASLENYSLPFPTRLRGLREIVFFALLGAKLSISCIKCNINFYKLATPKP